LKGPPPIDLLLRDRRLLITAGSGGVGKTTTAAAIALRAAQLGRNVALLTIDPARRLADALGLEALAGELCPMPPEALQAAGQTMQGSLWAMMLDIKTTGDQMVRRFAPSPQSAEAILENTYYKYFSTSLAGSQEYMAIEQVRAIADDPRFDLIVLDTPPAAHALDFLDAPERMLQALDTKAMQLLRGNAEEQGEEGLGARLMGRSRSIMMRSLSRLTGGSFIEELATFLGLFGAILTGLKASSESVRALLRSPETGFLLVTAPNRANVDEALHFRRALAERQFPFAGFVVNRVHTLYPRVEDDPEALAHALIELADVPFERRTALTGRMQVGMADHNRMARRDREAVARLSQVHAQDPWVVPLFPKDVRDLSSLDQLARCLAC
jgi:anion-transporting  ArsA/GET3 family ATPase